MKKLLTLAALLLFALSVQGQSRTPEVKVATVSREVVPALLILKKIESPGNKVVRLYRRPKAKIKKALSFTTPGDRPKVA